MPDLRRALLALLGSAALTLALSPPPAAASAAGEYTESIPDASGDTPTNDLINNGGASGGGDGSGESATGDGAQIATGTPTSQSAPAAAPTKADQKFAENGNAGQALLNLVGGSTRPDTNFQEAASAAEQSIGSRLLNGSGGGGIGTMLYLMLGASALWAIAVAVGGRRQGPVFS